MRRGNIDVKSTDPTAIKPMLEGMQFTPRDLIRINRPVLFALFSFGISLIATFRTFGTDRDLVHESYPLVADGWGAWYWLAQLRLAFYFFFFLVSLALAVQMLPLAFPRGRRSDSWPVSAILFLYVALWFLFIQTRYGTALALLAPAAVSGGFLPLFLIGGAACLVHKGAAGGILLLALWKILEGRKYGLLIAVLLNLTGIFAIHVYAGELAALAGYGVYVGWWDTSLPAANTPLKYYYMLAVLLLWKLRLRGGIPEDNDTANRLLILTLLFFPTSYYVVFAGRSFQMYSVVLLLTLLYAKVPRYLQMLLLVPYVADLGLLLFTSGFYF
jgi:hypothetical protein